MNYSETVRNFQERFRTASGDDNVAHTKVLDLVKNLKTEGKGCLTGSEEAMERADEIYRSFRIPDEDDKKAEERKEPIRIVYPITYAQIQASLSSMTSILHRIPFFPLEGRGPDFVRPARLMEIELQYQLDQSMWLLYFNQWLLDMFRFGFGKINTTYERQMAYIRQKRMISIFGLFDIPMGTEDRPVISQEGANFSIDDPFNTMFDPLVSIGDIQKGRFIFMQERMSKNELRLKADELEDGQPRYINVEGLPNLPTPSDVGDAGSSIRSRNFRGVIHGTSVEGGEEVLLDHCYVKLVPSDYGLSDLDRMQIWCLTMANESRIIRAAPSKFEHGLFPTSVIEYSPDLHSTINPGLAETVDGLQDTINWLINSRMANVRRVINDRYFICEDAVNADDIEQKRTYVRIKKEYARQGIDKFFRQVPMNDVTSSHWADAANIYQHLQRVTGQSDNDMGIQLPTKRSATEVANIAQLGTSRDKYLAGLLFVQGIRSLGMQMLANTQQFMQADRFFKVTASMAVSLGLPPEIIKQGYLQVSPEELRGQYTISMIDPSTVSDKAAQASALQELLTGAMQVPQLIQLLGLDLPRLVTNILQLRGVTNTSDLMSPPLPDSPEKMAAIMSLLQRPVQAQVMGEEKVMDQVQRGNLVPQPVGAEAFGGMMGGGANGGHV